MNLNEDEFNGNTNQISIATLNWDMNATITLIAMYSFRPSSLDLPKYLGAFLLSMLTFS